MKRIEHYKRGKELLSEAEIPLYNLSVAAQTASLAQAHFLAVLASDSLAGGTEEENNYIAEEEQW